MILGLILVLSVFAFMWIALCDAAKRADEMMGYE